MIYALEVIYYILDRFLSFIFGCYIFEGVSIGMILVCGFIFSILLTFLVNVPIIESGDKSGKYQK